MHIVIAEMSHETNTFSPVVTDLVDLGRDAELEIRFSGPGGKVRGTLAGPDGSRGRG